MFLVAVGNTVAYKADERMLAVFSNKSILRILHARHRDCVPTAELRRRLRITSIPAQLAEIRLRWFELAARRREGGLIRDFLLAPPHLWRERAGGQLKTWTTALKEELEPPAGPRIFGYARWRNDWVKVSCEPAQDSRAWDASVHDMVNWINDVCSTRPR